MKIDKETLIKERFWFLLPIIAIFLLISWICILVVRSDTAKYFDEAKTQNKSLRDIASAQFLKNPQWIQAMDKELAVSDAKKDDLWYTEYNRQNRAVREKDPLKGKLLERLNPFIVWPVTTSTKWDQLHPGERMNDMDFGGKLGNIPQDEFLTDYKQQYSEIVGVIRDWLDESNPGKIEGAVRVHGGSGNHRDAVLDNIIHPISLTNSKLVLSDEAWLVEEDIAVKRELFQSLADLLDNHARLKPEWAEVNYTEVKVVSAPAPAPAGGAAAEASPPPVGTPAAAATNGHSTPLTTEAAPESEVFQRVRFYNYVWPNLLDGDRIAKDDKLRDTVTRFGLPAVEAYHGWLLDLSIVPDPRDERKLVLRAVSANHSDKFKLPAMSLAVWFTEPGESGKELPKPLVLADAGNVEPCEYWPRGGLKRLSEKKLQDIPIPAGYGKIKRITRVLPENAIAQQICFNHDWLINVRLVPQPNRPSILNLVGEVINRSGRRLPGAFFTAGLTQANSSTPQPEEFNVATDAFNAGERKPFFKQINSPVPPRGLEFVSQKLTWRSTPIKRIDRLEIGALAHSQSDRLKVLPLKTYDFKKKEVAAAAAGASSTSQTQPAAPVPPTDGGLMPGVGGSSTGSELISPNQGIRLDRYTEVTTQLRRIPVAFVMIVDARAIDDIIGAMSNSRLRFQVTMAPWTRVANLGRPGGGGGAGAPASGGGGKMNPPPVGGGNAGRGPPGAPPDDAVGAGGGGQGKGGGAAPPPRSNAPAAAAASSTSQFGLEDDSSVVELQIYGIITIYESPDAQKKPSGTLAAADNASTPKQ